MLRFAFDAHAVAGIEDAGFEIQGQLDGAGLDESDFFALMGQRFLAALGLRRQGELHHFDGAVHVRRQDFVMNALVDELTAVFLADDVALDVGAVQKESV